LQHSGGADGGIAGSISLKGGEKIQKESAKWIKKHGPLSAGACAYTSGGLLAC